jgi:lysyl-tRNA synthetase class 2
MNTDSKNPLSPHDNHSLIQERKNKLLMIRKNCTSNGYPNHFKPAHNTLSLQKKYAHYEQSHLAEQIQIVSVAGRVIRKRGPFFVIQDKDGQIQTYADKIVQKTIKSQWGGLDVGDIIGVKGQLKLSGKGDLFVKMDEYFLLTKALRPLPEKYNGLKDQETKYRQRYIDLITNESTRNVFKIRTKIINSIRHFLTEQDFMEVETPMLQTLPGGAVAKPFATYHNAMNMDMYLRIAPELYLKRLVVGGFERVFEINRNFRNEGLSTRHNPEFTMLEFYQAYADFNDLMLLTEKMLQTVTQEVLGTQIIKNTFINPQSNETETIEYDFSQPFERLSMSDSILKYNPDFKAEVMNDPVNHFSTLREYAKSLHIKISDESKTWGPGKYLCEIFEASVEHRLMQPTFITEYPWEVSPLARKNDSNDFITDRFEFFVGGQEIANGFSELNDPEDQAKRFKKQAEEKEAGDDEAMDYDNDYIQALEYGLPPTAGEGIGIDRLVMLLTNSPTIKDVILFPHMKPN